MRNLKVFMAALAAAMALTTVAVASASASYHSEIEFTTYRGLQTTTNVLTTDVGNLECTSVQFDGVNLKGTMIGAGDYTVANLLLRPTYGKETGIGKCNLSGTTVEVDNNQGPCEYEYPAAVKNLSEKIKIVCPTGVLAIKDTAGLKCEIRIASQTTAGGVSFSNVGKGTSREVVGTYAVTGISYNWTAGCPNAKGVAGKDTNGTYTGKMDLEGENPSTFKQVGIWVA